MHDHSPVTHLTLGQTSKHAVDLVKFVDFELGLDFAHGYQFENVNQIRGGVMRRSNYGRLLKQHLNRIALNGLSTNSRCDQTAAGAETLYRLTILFHRR